MYMYFDILSGYFLCAAVNIVAPLSDRCQFIIMTYLFCSYLLELVLSAHFIMTIFIY